ncbi:hypothetical protein N7467_005420 [Penicillium canescens]|nr:hypothetical protein N7467_005420 [Penicillium canescens]
MLERLSRLEKKVKRESIRARIKAPSMSTISAVQCPIAITTERTASVPSFAPDFEIIKPALSNTVSTNRQSPSMNNKLSSTYSLVLSDLFNRNINLFDSPTLFFADRLHIYFETKESSAFKYVSQFLMYSIKQITVD